MVTVRRHGRHAKSAQRDCHADRLVRRVAHAHNMPVLIPDLRERKNYLLTLQKTGECEWRLDCDLVVARHVRVDRNRRGNCRLLSLHHVFPLVHIRLSLLRHVVGYRVHAV